MAQDWLERAMTEGTPVIDGKTATFVWKGKLAPRLIADFNGWEANGGTEFTAAGKALWITSVELPEDAYIEYSLMEFGEGETENKRYADPFNRRKVNNGIGKFNNYFHMPAGVTSRYLQAQRGISKGTVTSEVVKNDALVVGGQRKVHLYQPVADVPCPLVVVLDGQDYLRRAKITTILDNLIHAGHIPPLALAMPENGRQARMVEYGGCEVTLGFLAEGVIPLARQRLNLVDLDEHPGAYGIIGASMGGLMALFAGLRLPQVFGKLLPQSGAFALPGYRFSVYDLLDSVDPQALKIWMDVGRYEYLLECNREMAGLLEQKGFQVTFREYSGGHNYTAWANDLPEGLTYLFG